MNTDIIRRFVTPERVQEELQRVAAQVADKQAEVAVLESEHQQLVELFQSVTQETVAVA